MSTPIERRRWLVPEVVQSSPMDCGPASLKCLLEGFGFELSYARLREACQTDIDGTSIDVMEELIGRMGFEAAQVVVPAEFLWTRGADPLPAIAVLREPSGMFHFVVLWRRVGPFFQIMDPARGRHWIHRSQLQRRLHRHREPVPAESWRAWAGTDEFLGPLRTRLGALGVPVRQLDQLLVDARANESWRALAALDAAARLCEALARTQRVPSGMVAHVAALATADPDAVPRPYWSVRPHPAADDESVLEARGIVLLRTSGRRPMPVDPFSDGSAEPTTALPSALEMALTERSPGPLRQLLRLLRDDGLLRPAFVLLLLAIGAIGRLIEALVFRIMLDLADHLGLESHRLLAAAALMVFLLALLVLSLARSVAVRRMGRRLDARLGLAFLRKLPLLHDRFFSSRSSSDMAHRSHMLHQVGALPQLGAQLLETGLTLIAVVVGLAWLCPSAAFEAIAVAAITCVLPLVAQPLLLARDLKVRSFSGALTTYFMDALRGLVPLRAHGAEQSFAREHRRVLSEWARASVELHSANVGLTVAAKLAAHVAVVVLVLRHFSVTDSGGAMLLLVYWALRLPGLGEQLAARLRQYPAQRNTLLRLFEPLSMPEEELPLPEAHTETTSKAPTIRFEHVDIVATGVPILTELDLEIDAGTHVAIVGPSGAGKSSLLSTLLGWHKPHRGRITVDGTPLSGPVLAAMRQRTAWVDPSIQLWSGSLGQNIRYGAEHATAKEVSSGLEHAALRPVLERLPEGLSTSLGESGGSLSGGEGQRVRLGRAFVRGEVGLALLDEPFRGLDRTTRRRLLERSRLIWQHATVLCATHDVSDTAHFDRVLVIAEGRLVEDGDPQVLLQHEHSLYRRMLKADRATRDGLWASTNWTSLELRGGRVSR